MDSSKVLTTVCVLTITLCHGTGQSCNRTRKCFADLDIGLATFCSKAREVNNCYRKLSDCPELTGISTLRSSENPVRRALVEFCNIQDGTNVRSCTTNSEQATTCEKHLQGVFSSVQAQPSDYHIYSLMISFTACISSFLQRCDGDGANTMVSYMNELRTAYFQLACPAAHVIGQICTQVGTCFSNLDIHCGVPLRNANIGVKRDGFSIGDLITGDKRHILDSVCSKTREVGECYEDLTYCSSLESATIPGNKQVQTTLKTICQTKEKLRSCLKQYPTLTSELRVCEAHLQDVFSPASGQQRINNDTASRLVVQFISCMKSSVQTCDNGGTTRITSTERHLEPTANSTGTRRQLNSKPQTRPTSQPSSPPPKQSGCLKLESWPFLGVITALIITGLQIF